MLKGKQHIFIKIQYDENMERVGKVPKTRWIDSIKCGRGIYRIYTRHEIL